MKHNTTYVNCSAGFISCVRNLWNDTRYSMRVMLFVALVVGMILNANAQNRYWEWAKRAGGTSSDLLRGIATDGYGNCYVTGSFTSSSITFGSVKLTNSGSNTSDMYIVKYNSSGNVVWAKRTGGNETDDGQSIAADGSGNCYVTGRFGSSTITFGSVTLINSGSSDMYVVKYDSSGNVIWAKNATGTGDDNGQDVAVDVNGNCYVTGYFRSGTIAFDSITLTNTDTIGSTSYDMFVVKYSSIGNVIWAKNAAGSGADYMRGIAADANGNCYITGDFLSRTITFGNVTLTNADTIGTSGYDMYVVKYDNSGNVLWAKRAGGSYHDNGRSIAADMFGNCYVTGDFRSKTITFGNITLTNADTLGTSGYDMYVVKYDNSGNVLWAKCADGSNSDRGEGIAVDASGNCYVTGEFGGKIAFGSVELSSNGDYDIYVVKYDSSGNVVWAKSTTGDKSDYGNEIAVDGSGNCYIAGYFLSSPITFGYFTLPHSGTSTTDMYIAKLGISNGKLRTFKEAFSLATKAVKLKIKSNVVTGTPNEGTILENVFSRAVPKAGATLLGISTSDKIIAKTRGWLLFKNAATVQAFYTAEHTGQSFPMDSIRVSGKKSKALSKAITPTRKKYDNRIWAQGVLLRTNIIASDAGVLPEGFGDILLDTSFILIGREVNGMSLHSVATYLDSLMSLYATFGIGGTNAADEYNNLGNFASLLKLVNDGFYEAMSSTNYAIDTTNLQTGKKPYAVKLLGVKTPDEVGVVKYNPNWKQSQESFGTARGERPQDILLQQNYPNPFNPQTAIGFSLLAVGNVTLKVYDVLGQEVATLLNNEQIEEGMHEVQFDASRLSSGVYYYRLQAGAFTEVKKMVLMK